MSVQRISSADGAVADSVIIHSQIPNAPVSSVPLRVKLITGLVVGVPLASVNCVILGLIVSGGVKGREVELPRELPYISIIAPIAEIVKLPVPPVPLIDIVSAASCVPESYDIPDMLTEPGPERFTK